MPPLEDIATPIIFDQTEEVASVNARVEEVEEYRVVFPEVNDVSHGSAGFRTREELLEKVMTSIFDGNSPC